MTLEVGMAAASPTPMRAKFSLPGPSKGHAVYNSGVYDDRFDGNMVNITHAIKTPKRMLSIIISSGF
jgi:hypothetical protein